MSVRGRLPTTRWSLVARAGYDLGDPEFGGQARQSLEELCQSYWPALYGYLRKRGYSEADAEDLIQGFFANLIQRQSIATASESRGRFRAFLYAALDHFVSNEYRRENAQKRGGGDATFSLDQERLREVNRRFESSDAADEHADPVRCFDHQWAVLLVSQTLKELEAEYESSGRGDWFRALSPLLSASEINAEDRSAIAERLGLSATALKVAIHRLRKTYRDRLVQAVAETLDDPSEWGREREHLFRALGKN